MRGHGDDGLLPLKHDRIMPASAAGHLPLTTTLRSTVPKSTTQTSSQSSSSSFHPGQLLRRRHIMTSIIVLLATSAWHHFLTLESDQLDSSLLEGAAALEELQEALTLCRTSETALETTRASLRDSQRSIRRTKNAEALAAIGKERACTARLKDVEENKEDSLDFELETITAKLKGGEQALFFRLIEAVAKLQDERPMKLAQVHHQVEDLRNSLIAELSVIFDQPVQRLQTLKTEQLVEVVECL
eukprot:m.90365 g.90365  ORF g.90365 m.90365 type:complete len:244 (-) comp15007_c1_seq2:219-950(-)